MPEYAVQRRSVPSEPQIGAYDYADSFEVTLTNPDAHSAETWARTALEGSHPSVRRLIRLVHARILRFELGPCDERHVLGWRIARAEPDLLQLETGGSLGRGVIVARRMSPTTSVASTYVFFTRRRSRLIWTVVAPLHRLIAPYLLHRAARTLLPDSAVVA